MVSKGGGWGILRVIPPKGRCAFPCWATFRATPGTEKGLCSRFALRLTPCCGTCPTLTAGLELALGFGAVYLASAVYSAERAVRVPLLGYLPRHPGYREGTLFPVCLAADALLWNPSHPFGWLGVGFGFKGSD